METSGITFIYSNVYFEESELPFELTENIKIRAARESEIEKLKTHLSDAYGAASMWVIPFDHDITEVEDNGYKNTVYSPSKKIRWWVVAFNGSNHQIIELEKISSLTNPKLHFGVTFIYTEPEQRGKIQIVSYSNHAQIELLVNESRRKYQVIHSNELHKLKRYYNILGEHASEYENVKFTLDLYLSSAKLLTHSGLLTLSLFSIIESIIAHKPRLTETLDSITHQIKNKLNLLSKRFDHSVKHEEYFGEIAYPNLWSKLYSIRSDIAHGQKYEFEGQYKILISLEKINTYLDIVVKELIKLSIEDSQLIADLREC